ncbi:hypothetical protein JVU11DRAFT_10370 [Chiua virens]|nr:hypothetical protein JVU11DRAFT_10370 [Chiua virens]
MQSSRNGILEAGLYDLSIDKGAEVMQVTGEADRWPSIDAGTKLIMRVLFQRKQVVVWTVVTRPIGRVGLLNVPSTGTRNPVSSGGRALTVGGSSQECGGRFQILLEKKKNGNKTTVTTTKTTPEIDDDTRACIRNFRVCAIKHVAFCADGSEEIHEADDWDRSPVPVARPLSYGDLLELKALQRDLYLAPQPQNCQNRNPSVILPRVPIPLLRLNP